MSGYWNLKLDTVEKETEGMEAGRSESEVEQNNGARLFKLALETLATREKDSDGRLSPLSVEQERLVFGKTIHSWNASNNWKRVAAKARKLSKDPWEDLVAATAVERGKEFVYDVLSGTWSWRPLLVRIDTSNPVAKGRMRECYRMKKIMLPVGHELFSTDSSESESESEKEGLADSEYGEDAEAVHSGTEDSSDLDTISVNIGTDSDATPDSQKFNHIIKRMNDGDFPLSRSYSISDACAWFTFCKQPVFEVFQHLGRKSACRLRIKLGYPSTSIHHPTILTVGEVVAKAKETSAVAVEMTFSEECHSFEKEDFLVLHNILFRANKDDKSWKGPSLNIMAKRYMKEEDDTLSVYQEDVVMQEVCKRLTLQFNALQPPPPKKIDMLHVGLIQLVDRPNKPFFSYESFVLGEYKKWNTNAGWKDENTYRHTPHAFSFSSFRQTKGEIMIVDIQGVDDLYTDPQVHSRDGEGFGEGNLGPRGMALFLKNFRYDLNPIVQYLGLEEFTLMKGEQPPPSSEEIKKFQAGKSYLQSAVWRRRAARMPHSSGEFSEPLSRSTSIGSGSTTSTTWEQTRFSVPSMSFSSSSPDADAFTGENADDFFEAPWFLDSSPLPMNELNAIPTFLNKCAQQFSVPQCPTPIRNEIPGGETAEARVHLELAKLYEERDERIISEYCDPEEARWFHIWLAALGGSVPAQLMCAKHPAIDADSRLNWSHCAGVRGSRLGCLEAAELVPTADTLLRIYYLQMSLDCDDKKTERERRADFETCQHEVHAQLGAAFSFIRDLKNAKFHLETASELAMESGDYRSSEKYATDLATLGE